MLNEIDGDLIELAKQGEFDLIGHGCNCFCIQGAGIAVQMNKNFGTGFYSRYPLEHFSQKGNPDKLGKIEACAWYNNDVFFEVLNIYTQWLPGVPNHTGIPLDYAALEKAMRTINFKYQRKHLGIPWIGCGLAGGDQKVVRQIISANCLDMDVTIVNYTKPKKK